MADRTSAALFATIFEWLAENPDERSREFARRMWSEAGSYDFNWYQMGCDEALVTLGLAQKTVVQGECVDLVYFGDDNWADDPMPAPASPGPAARPDYPPGKVVHLIDAVGSIVCGSADPLAEGVGFRNLANCPECLAVMPGATPAPAAEPGRGE